CNGVFLRTSPPATAKAADRPSCSRPQEGLAQSTLTGVLPPGSRLPPAPGAPLPPAPGRQAPPPGACAARGGRKQLQPPEPPPRRPGPAGWAQTGAARQL